jgi:hypothetical protein
MEVGLILGPLSFCFLRNCCIILSSLTSSCCFNDCVLAGAVTSRGLPEWQPDYLISAFHGKWEEEFSLGFQMDPHRDWGGFSGKSNIRGNASFPSINPSTQVELDAIDCKQQVFKEWKAITTRENDQKTVVSCTVDKLLGESVASTQLAAVGVSCKPGKKTESSSFSVTE